MLCPILLFYIFMCTCVFSIMFGAFCRFMPYSSWMSLHYSLFLVEAYVVDFDLKELIHPVTSVTCNVLLLLVQRLLCLCCNPSHTYGVQWVYTSIYKETIK